MPPSLLEIGPGRHPLDSATAFFDITPDHTRRLKRHTHIGKWGADPIPGKWDAIFASHVIEHVDWWLVDTALLHAFAALSPGGSITLWTVDAERAFAAFLANQCGDNWRRFNPEGDPWKWANGRFFAYGPDHNLHRSFHTPTSLANRLALTGFTSITPLTNADRTVGLDHGSHEFGITAIRP